MVAISIFPNYLPTILLCYANYWHFEYCILYYDDNDQLINTIIMEYRNMINFGKFAMF